MSCSAPESKPDWKSYALGEMNAAERRDAESHATACAACREELATVRLTLDALSTLREEEMPRRIAFVSDKVFEPRWWQRLWNPNFAAACVIAAAILVHAFARPAANDAEVQAKIDAAVIQAVAQVEQQHTEATARILADYENRFRQMYVTTTGLVRQ